MTPWLRISRPGDCFNGSCNAMNQAVAAARRAGHSVDDYGRLVLYLACSGCYAGLAEFPGRAVWLYGSLATSVVTHEQRHNLGLDHASSRQCRRPGSSTHRVTLAPYETTGPDIKAIRLVPAPA